MIEITTKGIMTEEDAIFLKFLVNDFMFEKDNNFKDLKNFARPPSYQENQTEMETFNTQIDAVRKKFVMAKIHFDAVVHMVVVNKVSLSDALIAESKDKDEEYLNSIKSIGIDAISFSLAKDEKQLAFFHSLPEINKNFIIQQRLEEQVTSMQEFMKMWHKEFENLSS